MLKIAQASSADTGETELEEREEEAPCHFLSLSRLRMYDNYPKNDHFRANNNLGKKNPPCKPLNAFILRICENLSVHVLSYTNTRSNRDLCRYK